MSESRSQQGKKPLLYQQVATRIRNLVEHGTYRPGERLPSVRALSRKLQVSINTVMEAYAQLESQRLIDARPQSGYYVCGPHENDRASALKPAKNSVDLEPSPVQLADLSLQIMRSISDPNLISLGSSRPALALLPAQKLNRILAAQSRRWGKTSVSYAATAGIKSLRTQIAKRALDYGCALTPEDIVITSGCVEAVTLALQATCRPGDTVAVNSPVYYTFLNSMRWMGLKILEIPSDTRTGINVDVLRYALRQNSVQACITISDFNNPLGSLMPDEKKRELVEVLTKHDIPLIDDNVYGDLAFGTARPMAAKAWDKKGLVLHCSSFSKTLAPGYRVGFIAPGRYCDRVVQIKALFNIASASPNQLAIAEFLTSGGYDRHLRTVRRVYARQLEQMQKTIERCFPEGTRVAGPAGGFVTWVELPEEIDTVTIYRQALAEGMSIAPGRLFTNGSGYENCLRLSAAVWSEKEKRAVETLGGLARALTR